MEHGSTHVWMYDCSDEEFISDSELQEGMWLSDSDDEDKPPQPGAPQPINQQQPQEGQDQQQLELISSTTKYEHIPDRSPSDGISRNYADLELATGGPPPPPPPPPPSSNEKPVEYVELRQPPPIPPAIQVKPPSEPHRREAAVKPPNPPPLPPAPKGIIKTRLVPGLRKMRKQRVRWESPRPNLRDSHESQRGRRTRRTDTNVLAVKFNTLTGPSHVHTGDRVVCCNPQCTSILSHLSKVEGSMQDEKEWMCEFCGSKNLVDVVPEELPTEEDTTYMIAPAPLVGGGAGGGAGTEDSLVIFCIDISGSMCVTTEVAGKFELKGHDRVRGLSSFNMQGEDQYMPRQRRDVTYVSRLQSVQAAVDHQLTTLTSSHPTQKVSLVTFSDEVTVIGDGRGEVVTIAGDKLWNSDAVVKVGGEVTLPAAVRETRSALSEKVFDLEEGGQTALGPALLLCVTVASRVPGSKVIICTDGLANKGVGNLDDLSTDEAKAAAQTFYEDLGALALEKNVTVSLVTIKGTDCKTLELGQVADTTGGQVTIVDPLNITKEFSSILANPVIATDVMTKIVLHNDLYFRTEEFKDSMLTIPVGNVTAETELSYEYGVRNKKKEDATPPPPDSGKEETSQDKGAGGGATAAASPKEKVVSPLMIDGKPYLPFQLQIEYTGQDGSRCIRVITQAKPITRDRDVAERDIQMAVVGTHAAHTTAKLAMEGEFTHARMNALVSQRLMQRTSHASAGSRFAYQNVMEDLIPLENELRDRQQRERTMFGRQYSDDEDEEQFVFGHTRSELMGTKLAKEDSSTRSRSEPIKKLMKAAPRKKKAISRRKDISDNLATYCYQMRSSKSSDYAFGDEDSDEEED